MSKCKTVKFSSLKIGDKFDCYGDVHLNYDYPKICRCVKVEFNMASEIDGINFGMNESDEVFIKL